MEVKTRSHRGTIYILAHGHRQLEENQTAPSRFSYHLLHRIMHNTNRSKQETAKKYVVSSLAPTYNRISAPGEFE